MVFPVDDICIEAELDLRFNPTDPRYDPTFEAKDNRVASRTLTYSELPYLLNFGIDKSNSVIGPQVWLIHDLTEHGYGVGLPQVPPK